jgi:hypothetical protein
MNQKAVDAIARTFYTGLAVAGCLASAAFVALGLYGATSEPILKYRLFFAGLAVSGIATGNRNRLSQVRQDTRRVA